MRIDQTSMSILNFGIEGWQKVFGPEEVHRTYFVWADVLYHGSSRTCVKLLVRYVT